MGVTIKSPKAASAAECQVLEQLPNIGPSLAADLRLIGIQHPKELRGKDAFVLYQKLCAATGQRHDVRLGQHRHLGEVEARQRLGCIELRLGRAQGCLGLLELRARHGGVGDQVAHALVVAARLDQSRVGTRDLRAHGALLGHHVPFARRQLDQIGHPVLANNLRAHVLCADRQRVADPRRIGVTIIRGPRARDHAIQRHERVVAQDFLWRNDFHVEADDLRHAFDLAHPGQLALVRGQPDPARLVP